MAITRTYSWDRPIPVVVPWRRNPTTLYSSTVPSTTSTTPTGWIVEWASVVQPLSTADNLNARYQAAYNAWNTDLANLYKNLNQENSAYNRVANQVTDYYNALAQDVAQREQWLAWAKYDVANRLFNDMASQRDYVYGLYGPQGTFTKEVNTYYDDLWDYLASEAGREMAYADALWAQSWASIWMMRAQRNQAYNEAFQRSLQVMQQELEAKQNIQQNLINFMTTLRQEYWDTANAYIISQYERANDLLNAISQNIATTNANIATAKLSAWGGGWWQQQNSTKTIEDMSDMEVLQLVRDNKVKQWEWADYLADWSVAVSYKDADWNVKNRIISTWWIANAWFRNRDALDYFLWWGTWAQAWTWS